MIYSFQWNPITQVVISGPSSHLGPYCPIPTTLGFFPTSEMMLDRCEISPFFMLLYGNYMVIILNLIMQTAKIWVKIVRSHQVPSEMSTATRGLSDQVSGFKVYNFPRPHHSVSLQLSYPAYPSIPSPLTQRSHQFYYTKTITKKHPNFNDLTSISIEAKIYLLDQIWMFQFQDQVLLLLPLTC